MRLEHRFGRRGRALLLAVGLAAWPSSAQNAFPLRAVEFEGDSQFEDGELLSVTRLVIGEPVVKADFDAALRRLSETGLFEGLSYRYSPQENGYRLTVQLQELAELFPVRFDGFGVEDGELAALLAARLPLYNGLVPAGGPMVRMVVNALQGWWRSRGGEEEVAANLAPAVDGGLEMVVGPERQSSNIAFTRFSNTGEVDSFELQRVFNHAATGEPYSEARLLELLHYNARPAFTEQGYMAVKFCPCEARPDPDSLGLLIDVHVEPGDVYSFGELNWPEPLPVSPDSLAKVNRIAPGQVANIKAAYDTMAGISEAVKRQGYMKAQATFEERIDHERRLVHLDIEIALGMQYRFSRLIVSGLDILSEPAVRKRWGMQSGEPFDVRYPAYFLDRVKADAMFENLRRTSWKIDVDEASGRVDVTLLFFGMSDDAR